MSAGPSRSVSCGFTGRYLVCVPFVPRGASVTASVGPRLDRARLGGWVASPGLALVSYAVRRLLTRPAAGSRFTLAAYTRCLAVRERRGDREWFRLSLPSFLTAVSLRGARHRLVQFLDVDMAFAEIERLGTGLPHPFRAGRFRGFLVHTLLQPVRLLAPCTDQTGTPATGGFYFRLSTVVSLPVAGYDYVTGLLCWRALTRWNGS